MDGQAPRQCHSPSNSRYTWPSLVAGGKRDLGQTVSQLGLLLSNFCCSLLEGLPGAPQSCVRLELGIGVAGC